MPRRNNNQKAKPELRSFSLGVRALTYAKFNGRCAYCGQRISRRNFTVDHIIPRSAGGETELSNLNPACRTCNELKADLTMEEWRKLRGTLYCEQ